MGKVYTNLDEAVDYIAAAIDEGVSAKDAVNRALANEEWLEYQLTRIDVMTRFNETFLCLPLQYQQNVEDDAAWAEINEIEEIESIDIDETMVDVYIVSDDEV